MGSNDYDERMIVILFIIFWLSLMVAIVIPNAIMLVNKSILGLCFYFVALLQIFRC